MIQRQNHKQQVWQLEDHVKGSQKPFGKSVNNVLFIASLSKRFHHFSIIFNLLYELKVHF